MYRLITLIAVTVFLTGCATGPKVQPKTEQFCDMTTKTVRWVDEQGNAQEQTLEVMVCEDNQIKRLFQVQSGMASNCGEFTYQVNGSKRKGVSCQKPDGRWEIVNTSQW